ncbi:MAG: DUF2750 domain-containing protein [Agriterribacter sp.]
MYQDHIAVKQRHQKFIKKVCDTGIVYGLESEDGFATSSSNASEDDNDEPIGIICFWSEKALAKSCIKNEWQDYQVVEISLSEFMENWCVGMSNDGLLVGTNFDQNMFGYEAHPLELILDLVTYLRAMLATIDFKNFLSLDDLEVQVRAIMQKDA